MPPVPRYPGATIDALRNEAQLFYLDGAGVLFCERTQTLHLLNSTAALVYSLLQEGHDASSAARELQQLQGVDASVSTRHVDQALESWEAIRATPTHSRTEPSVAGKAPAPSLPPYLVATSRCYRLSGTTFRIAFADVEHAHAVHPVLAHLEIAPEPADVAVDIVNESTGVVVYQDGKISETCASTEELAPVVKSLVWITAVNRHDFLLDIHAGVVGNGEACLLLPGAPGSGKSTLTAALVHAGYLLYSDEVALLADGSLDVYPLPLAICVKSSGIEALAGRFPQLRALPRHLRADGKRVSYLSPPAEWLPPSTLPRPVAALVFPTYSPESATQLVRLPAFEALRKLLDECLVLRERLDFRRIERLVAWVGSIPAYRLEHATVDAAFELMAKVLPMRKAERAGRRAEAGPQGSRRL